MSQASSNSKPLVLVTGISGYLGSHVCFHFLKDGRFRVRGTVRSIAKRAKIDPLKKAFGDHFFSEIDLVEADLLDEASLVKAAKGCKYIVHTASPFPLGEPKDEQELIKPAVEGTLAIMKAAKLNGVKRVVVTSSVAAVTMSADSTKKHFGPDDWSELDLCRSYMKSKTLAEKAAWKYLEDLPDGEKFELATVLPGFIIGPNYNTCQFSSGDLIRKLLLREIPCLLNMKLGVIDVRDCAQAHFAALTVAEAANQRFIAVHESVWLEEIAQWLYTDFGKYYDVPTYVLPAFVTALGANFSNALKRAQHYLGKDVSYDNQGTVAVLGIKQFRNTKRSINEMVATLIDTQYIPDLRVEEEITNSCGVLLAILFNLMLSFRWAIFGVYLFSETWAYGLHAVMTRPKTYLRITIGTLQVIQTFQCFGLLLPIMGITKTPIIQEALQLLMRALFAFISTKYVDESKGPWLFLALFSFLVGDGVRYPYYVLKTLGAERSLPGRLFGNLRYNVWLVFYPLGAFSDTMAGIYSAQPIAEAGAFSYSLPNTWNFEFSYPFLCGRFVPAFLAIAFWVNYFHLWNQRKKFYNPYKIKSD